MEREFDLNLRERPFEAIKRRTKNVEVRANKEGSPVATMSRGDVIVFTKYGTCEKYSRKVDRVIHYKSVRELLVAEGVEQTLSSGKDLEDGIKSIESISGYKQAIKARGVFAIVLA